MMSETPDKDTPLNDSSLGYGPLTAFTECSNSYSTWTSSWGQIMRLIYYWRRSHNEIWMLTIYAKNEEASIPSHFVRRLREEIDNE